MEGEDQSVVLAVPEDIEQSKESAPVVLIHCPRCGRDAPQAPRDPHLCHDCVKAENNRLTYYRQHQEDWVTVAKESGIDLWLQQPRETQWEYTVWCAYRDSYPGKKPTYSAVAKQLDTTYNVVNRISQRWSFPVRMQAWMTECDRITMAQRRQEILNMNSEHVTMAATLRGKLVAAIDRIDPMDLKPSEISSLFKLSAELERKARTDTLAQEQLRRDLLVDNENAALRKEATKQSDLSEVVQILMKAGALGDITKVGVRQTATTEIVVQDEDGQSIGGTVE